MIQHIIYINIKPGIISFFVCFVSRLPYHKLVGGVFNIRPNHYFLVNGYSNLYWGWGGEDDDMGYR